MSEDLEAILKDIREQLTRLIAVIDKQVKSPVGYEWKDLLQLPKHLQRTAITLGKLGRATASQVAENTGIARAIESSYLNQLIELKLARKERVRRFIYFIPVIE